MAALKEIKCPMCDGTGHYIDTFDLPKSQNTALKSGVINKDKYTKAGYRIDETKNCNVCEGRRYITIVDL